jgi:hypothetical protein
MSAVVRLAIISDIHFAGPAETARRGVLLFPIRNPLRRWMVKQYRRWIWLNDPFAHNHLLDRILSEVTDPDLVIANGDFSCDSAYVGVMDDAAFESAILCLQKLRSCFGSRLRTTIGDHEIGKKMLAADEGGLRLQSFHRSQRELKLDPFWKIEFGCYVLIGITSTLVALPVFERETLPEELDTWRQLRIEHLQRIREAFETLRPDQRVLLFCHDPTALPFLADEEIIQRRLAQISRTVIGHLHSPAVLKQSLRLAGIPSISFLGHTPRRLSLALRQARYWARFKIVLCPSPPGIQLFRDGGYLTATLDLGAKSEPRFHCHPLLWTG